MENNKQQYWEMRWQQLQTGWDLGVVSPPIKHYIDTLTDKNQRILIPGCGNAHEAIYFLENGFSHITVIDIAPTLTNALTHQLHHFIEAHKLTIICGDFFDLTGQFDLIVEQTFFCAIDPYMRNQYAHQIKSLLAKGGKVVGLLFNKTFDGGPPYGGHIAEYEDYFMPIFKDVLMKPCLNSAQPRAGNELWIELTA